MIEIDLKLFVSLAGYHPSENSGGSGPHRVPEGTRVDRLIQDLGIPEGSVKLIFINGKKASQNQELFPGDRVGLFPPVGGG